MLPEKFIWATIYRIFKAWASQRKCFWSPKGLMKFSLENTTSHHCSHWKYDTLHAIVECGSAFFEDISRGNANFSELPHTLNTGGNINISFVLSSKGTLVCNSSSSVLVLNRTSPSLLLIRYSTFHCHFPTYR